jgi:hypothetical protein
MNVLFVTKKLVFGVRKMYAGKLELPFSTTQAMLPGT